MFGASFMVWHFLGLVVSGMCKWVNPPGDLGFSTDFTATKHLQLSLA